MTTSLSSMLFFVAWSLKKLVAHHQKTCTHSFLCFYHIYSLVNAKINSFSYKRKPHTLFVKQAFKKGTICKSRKTSVESLMFPRIKWRQHSLLVATCITDIHLSTQNAEINSFPLRLTSSSGEWGRDLKDKLPVPYLSCLVYSST